MNLGAGLDDTFLRVDNGCIRWYNLDLPDAIAYRERFIKPTERCRNIAKSMFDYSWLDEVQASADAPALLLAAGLFFYFDHAQIEGLFREVCARFTHGVLFFETCSESGTRIANRMVKKTGNSGAEMRFWVNRAEEVKAWSPNIKEAVCLPYFGARAKDRRFSRLTRLIMWGGDFLKRTKFVRVT
ncbi:MAG: class I SAM-dependent methyltransferase, partial [Coriobacteriales bacterium]|nr:class I SAM-dependent methyltransferase [Coriobacteriales bacterium]